MIGKTTMNSIHAAIVTILSVVLLAGPAEATPMVDQSFTSPDDLTALINEGCKYVAQTFTAGVTGSLTGVNIDVKSKAGAPPLRVVIRGTLYGKPFGDALGVRYLWYPQAPLSRLITFNQQIPMVAGQQYAIVVSYKGVEPGNGLGDWSGGTGNHYVGGRHISGECPTYGDRGFWHVWPLSFDLHFRTYVEPAK